MKEDFYSVEFPKPEPPVVICPKCKNTQSARIPRSKWVKILLPFLNIRRYVCYQCLSKFHKVYRG